MAAAKYIVDLTPEEREQLLALIGRGKASARQTTRAHILLHAHERLSDEQIAHALHIGSATVGRVRQRFVEEGLESALRERPRPGKRPKLTDKQEAHLIAVTCSQAPHGHERWSLRLLADKIVELGLVDAISHETVRQTLKKTNSSRGRNKLGAFPPSAPPS